MPTYNPEYWNELEKLKAQYFKEHEELKRKYAAFEGKEVLEIERHDRKFSESLVSLQKKYKIGIWGKD